MSEAQRYFLIVRRRGDGIEWPVFDTTGGGRAPVFFTEGRRAERFRRARGFGAGWHTARMEPAEFVRWLRDHLLRGITQILPDPDPADELHRAVPIFPLLVEAER